MIRFVTYLDYEFINKWYKLKPDQTSEDFDIWKDVFRFCQNRCQIVYLSRRQVHHSNNGNILLRYVYGSCSVVNENVIFIDDNPLDKLTKHPFTLAFTDGELPEHIKNDVEILKLNGDNLFSIWSKLWGTTEKLFTKDKNSPGILRSWSDLGGFFIKSNRYVIIDPFVLQNDSRLSNNLVELLEVLLDSLEGDSKITAEILIVVHDVGESNLGYKAKLEQLSSKIKDLLSKPNIDLTILRCRNKNEIHERHIISRYYDIHFGNSLNVFSSDDQLWISNPVSVTIKPLTAKNDCGTFLETVMPHLKSIQKIIDSGNFDFAGKTEHELLNFEE
jgi:hypothetical protein